MNRNHKRSGLTLAACGLLVALGAPAQAAGASPWADDLRSSLRLIAGQNAESADTLRAGIEIKLQPGWHTYWRYPGDSGVPPRFSLCRLRQRRDRQGALSGAARL